MTDRVLAFGCHPDDVEFMSSGTLALLAERGLNRIYERAKEELT